MRMGNAVMVTSTRTSAGKTTVALGLAMNSGAGRPGYFKPLGDQMMYEKKLLCDEDAALFSGLFGIECPGRLTLGFDPKQVAAKAGKGRLLEDAFIKASEGRALTLVESARNFSYGRSIGLDAISMAKHLGLDLLLVADGDPDIVFDKCSIVAEMCARRKQSIRGIIINKAEESVLPEMKATARRCESEFGVPVLGIVPDDPVIRKLVVETLAEKLHAKVVAGFRGLSNEVKFIVVGAMSAETATTKSAFHREGKLVITGGDRADFILKAIESRSAGILLTNNVVPHPSILSQADEKQIPILSISNDTFTAAKLVERIQPETKAADKAKAEAIKKSVRKNVDVKRALKG